MFLELLALGRAWFFMQHLSSSSPLLDVVWFIYHRCLLIYYYILFVVVLVDGARCGLVRYCRGTGH